MEQASRAREDDWLRVVILEENCPHVRETNARARDGELQSCEATEAGLQEQCHLYERDRAKMQLSNQRLRRHRALPAPSLGY
jgi:hypothetical protein